MDNLDTLWLKVVTDLLLVLRSEGFTNLPKTAQTLLSSVHCRTLQQMLSSKKTTGQCMHLGIGEGLKKVISNKYTEDQISVFIHIDGMQIFKSSAWQLWPIAVKVFHKNYVTKPFVASIFCGDGKPGDVHEYLDNFITDANDLINNGFTLHERNCSFRILGIIADAPARAFLKCCKHPGGFYACERCETRGLTMNTNIRRKKGQKMTAKRVYPEINSEIKTKKSFRDKKQAKHHQENKDSPLLLLSNFDPVKEVILDLMHLLYAGVMKSLLVDKWTSRKSITGLKLFELKKLKNQVDLLSSGIPREFQRTNFDLNLVAQWKATQFRFFLHYCGPFILKDLLSRDLFRHFMLLIVACRVFNSSELNTTTTNYAKNLLIHFLNLMPSLYGKDSQVLNYHNFIHVTDDVEYFGLPLSAMSAF